MTDLFSKLNDLLKTIEKASFTKPIEVEEEITIIDTTPKKQMFRFKGNGSDKFWEVWVEKRELKVRFGKYDTKGRIITKDFSSNEEAIREMEKRIKEKINKGYSYEGLKSEEVEKIESEDVNLEEKIEEKGKIEIKETGKFNPVEWEHSFEGGEIVEAYYNGSGFIGEVVRVSGQRVTNPKSVRVEEIKDIYPKTPYTIPKIEASKWSPFRYSLVPLKNEELIMYNDGEDLVAIWKVRKNKGVETMADIWKELGKELKMINKIKSFLEFLHNEFPISFPKSEDNYELIGNFIKFFGKESDNNFQNDDILDAKGMLLEFDEVSNDILKGKIIYAKLVRSNEKVIDVFREYSKMDDPQYQNERFEMFYWDFEKQLPFRIYHIKYTQIIIEDWTKKEKKEELREEVQESLEEFVEEHKPEFEERTKEIKTISWNLSRKKFKSSLERAMVVIDIELVMKELKSLMTNEKDLISYGYDKEKEIYYLEYDSTKHNAFLIGLIDHLINRIIQRDISLKTIKPNIDEIKERMKAYEQIEKKKSEKSIEKKVKKEEIEELYEVVFEEIDVEDSEKELEDNILGIICNVLSNSDWDKVFQKYLFGRLYGLGYQDSDFVHIRKTFKELEDLNLIKKEFTYAQNKPYFVLGKNKKLCEEKEFEINPVNINVPLLYEYPNISTCDIGKRIIVQILCSNSKQYDKNRGSYIDTLKSKWLNFFKYTYKPSDKPEDYHYLRDDLGITTLLDTEKKLKNDLDELLKDGIIVLSTPPPKYKDLIRLQKDYAFIWKTYEFGIFSEIQEISENTLFVNEKRIKDLKDLKEFRHIEAILKSLFLRKIKNKEDYYCVMAHREKPIYLIYDRTEFSLIEFKDEKETSFNTFSLGMNRKLIQSEIIKYFQLERGIHKIEKQKYRKWKSLRSGKLITLAVGLKF